jgi:hypothetical protein
METTTLSPVRQSIENILKEQGLTFAELDSRMNYAMIGHIKRNNEVIVDLFPKCFYIRKSDFSLNATTLPLIASIQKEFENNTRDERNRIVTVVLNPMS